MTTSTCRTDALPPASAGIPAPARTARRWRRALAGALLLLVPLACISIWLVIFQPFADAVGGCGGG